MLSKHKNVLLLPKNTLKQRFLMFFIRINSFNVHFYRGTSTLFQEF